MKIENLRLFRENKPRSAAENMAIDEMLLFTVNSPVFRSYSWLRPSVSFGYFVPWNVVASRYNQRDLVRRWTGGGIVEHGEDFTYSLILPASRNLPATGKLYQHIHLAIEDLLRTNGCPAEMALRPDPVESSACFEKAVEFDLKLRGEKIAGAAIRRNRTGLLLQGSIQRLKIPEWFGAKLAGALGEQIDIFRPSDLMMEKAAGIAREKYAATEWNCRL